MSGTTLNDMYFTPTSLETDKQINILWSKLTNDRIVEHKICKVAHGRTLRIPEYSGGVAKMTFNSLCDENYASSDYIGLC